MHVVHPSHGPSPSQLIADCRLIFCLLACLMNAWWGDALLAPDGGRRRHAMCDIGRSVSHQDRLVATGLALVAMD
jgi:hypothetical protein